MVYSRRMLVLLACAVTAVLPVLRTCAHLDHAHIPSKQMTNYATRENSAIAVHKTIGK